MIGSLLILGFTLSLDNFRTAIALGGLRPNWRQAAAHVIRIRPDLLTGVALVVMATVLGPRA